MLKPRKNILFNYLYRDGSNYKDYGSIIFSNLNNIALNRVEAIVRENLIDGEYFYAKEWDLPDLFFEESNCDDHEFHEFVSVKITSERQNSKSIEEFISLLKT